MSLVPLQLLNICPLLPGISIPTSHLLLILERPCSRCWAIPGNGSQVENLENPQGKQRPRRSRLDVILQVFSSLNDPWDGPVIPKLLLQGDQV